MTLTFPPAAGTAERPQPRGRVSEMLLDRLSRPVHAVGSLPEIVDDPIVGEDAPFALYLLYELHYQGLPSVDEAWEWEPTILRERRRLERAFEHRLGEMVGLAPLGLSADATVEALRALAGGSGNDGPSLSAHVEQHATLEQVRELTLHRSAYQLKEADPHTWGIPRLTGRAKAAIVEIQKGEYGDGAPDAVHSRLFAQTMDALGLDAMYGAYLDLIPGLSLSTCNLISLFGLHRQWRGALVGHLALFEMCSVGPMGRYSRGLQRLGFDERATRFYDEHVIADEHHQVVALDDLVRGLLEDEPVLGGEVVYGAMALQEVEAAFASHILDAWARDDCSLRAASPDAPR